MNNRATHDEHETGTIGWLGSGRLGTAMATRLVEAGHDVLVWNRTASKTAPLAERGAKPVAEIADLGDADVVFVTVSTSADLEQVVAGPSGLLAAARRPPIIVDCSTVEQDCSARIRGLAHEAGVRFLAAPVSGNAAMVAAGRACIVASGPAEVFHRVEPYLTQMVKSAVHVGDQEQSRLVKLCHNLYLGMMVQALAEVMSLAEKGGADLAAFLEFLNSTVLGSDWVRGRTQELVTQDCAVTFTTELLRKDFDLGLAAARALEVPMPIGASVHQLIQSAIGIGLREYDMLSLYLQQALVAALPVEVLEP
jgi:3-hydroxyisobutyrate dehydrogenase-like beta-hydroxyacid dehydrogenase